MYNEFCYSCELLSQILAGTIVIFGPGPEKKWHGTYSDKPDRDWDRTAQRMMLNFAEWPPCISGHERLERGEIRSKGKGKKSVHFNGSEETIELILRTIISVNQLSICGAVADLCKELSNDSYVAGKFAANEDLESMERPTELPVADPHTSAELVACRRVPLLHLRLLLQHLHRRILICTENPARDRSETMSEESPRNPSRGFAET